MRPRPVLHENEAETKSNYCETDTETETKKGVSRPRWSGDLNIPDNINLGSGLGLEFGIGLASFFYV